MKQMTVGDFKAHFSSVLEEVMQGEVIQILFGRAKIAVACLTQMTDKIYKRRIPGLYKDYGPYWEDESFEITPEWLFDDMNDLMEDTK